MQDGVTQDGVTQGGFIQDGLTQGGFIQDRLTLGGVMQGGFIKRERRGVGKGKSDVLEGNPGAGSGG